MSKKHLDKVISLCKRKGFVIDEVTLEKAIQLIDEKS